MKVKTAGLLSIGFLLFLFFTGCSESTLENDTTTDSEGTLKIFRSEDGLADNTIMDIAIDYVFNGVWFATRNGISFYSKADSTFFTYGVEYVGIPNMKVTTIHVDFSGTVWAGTEKGVG